MSSRSRNKEFGAELKALIPTAYLLISLLFYFTSM
jgi:hypothetical protein